ncbi:MAG TPA: hypothetical protein VLG74_01800 [Blastocatellia bacterium]|nr:hypothetical protein [Blastocatellia bacterium]
MERITQRSIALAVTLMLVLATAAMSAPKSERSKKYLTIEGRVLQVNREARTLLVSDSWSKKLYLVNVPKGEAFRITFGMFMNITEAGIEHVRKNNLVRMRCIRSSDKEHLARLDDGREVVVLTATH